MFIFIQQIPNGCPCDAEAAAGFGDADPGIVVNKTAVRDGREQAGALLAIGCLGGQARRRAREFGPGHLPKRERGGVAVIQNRICLCAVRNQNERRAKNILREFRCRKTSHQQLASRPMLQAAGDKLCLGDDQRA